MKLKIYWEHSRPENTKCDEEFYNSDYWTDRLDIKEVDNKDIRKVFEEQDGDCDFSTMIVMVCDDKDEILWRVDKYSDKDYDYQLEKFLKYTEKIDQWRKIEEAKE